VAQAAASNIRLDKLNEFALQVVSLKKLYGEFVSSFSMFDPVYWLILLFTQCDRLLSSCSRHLSICLLRCAL